MTKPDHRIITVYRGSTEESWLTVYKDGRIQQHTENDGWRYVNHGAEAVDKWITLDDVRKMGRRHGDAQTFIEQVEEAIRVLNDE
jgi:hypothetical protein